ncbi:isoform A [Brachionus plicatilis]|uniref:Isoform A n=1 Tax=Brachionus plicatilis TaxID=10195 RepID=A0A3M7QH72_BRAPC|nr:isoform A [Brachionus plicatilis]
MATSVEELVKIFQLVEQNEKKQRNMKPFLRPGSKTFFEHDLKIRMLLRKQETTQNMVELKQTYTCIKKHSSFKQFDQLEKVTLKQMYVNKVHEGKYLEAKIIYEPFIVTAIQTLIEDENGDIETLSIYNLIKDFGDNLKNLLPYGCMVKIKEPFLKTSVYSAEHFSVRVDSPSDLEIVISIPKIIDQDKTALYEKFNYEGNCHFVKKEHRLAVHSYTKALSLKQCAKSFSNRALAYLKLECYQQALIDAEKSVQIEPNEKGYYRMATAWYNMRQFDQSLQQFNKCLGLNGANRDAKVGMEKCLKRIEESKGVFDFKYFIEQSAENLRVDGADFVSDKIEIADVDKKGRGFVAKVDIPKNTLLVASKALSISFDSEFVKKYCLISYNLMNRTANNNSQCKNLFDLIYRMRFDPYLSDQVYSLYAGKKFNQNKLPPNGIIDTERIEAIHTFNSFKSDDLRLLGKSFENSGLWHMPSFFNHSCLPNTYRVHLSDFVFIFTDQDVKQGEEITISYFPINSFEEREKRANFYGFKCHCPVCEEDRNDMVNIKKRAQLFKNMENLKTNLQSKKLLSLIENLKKTYQKRDRFKYDLISPLGFLAFSFLRELNFEKGNDYFKEVISLSRECKDLTTAIKMASEISRTWVMTGDAQEADKWRKSITDIIQLDPALMEHIINSNHMKQNDKI